MNKLVYLIALLLVSVSCKNTPQYNDPIPEHDNFTLNSNFVNEDRVINVWVPPTYKTSEQSFPVLYMPDGGIKEDFPHIANTLAKLIAEKQILPIILVGIENTERGRDLTGFSEVEADAEYCPLTDGAKNFRAFITDELVPDINNKYRTTHKKGIIGESLAGLFVMETFMLQPEAFDFFIAMDPSLWWNDFNLVKEATNHMSQFPDGPKKLWFAGSGVEDISKHTNNLAKILETNAPKNVTWTYSDEPNEQHNTIFRATKEKALVWSLD
ncbi:alpha/beta hydrolase [Bizionia psychrotolerans]|uniref:alpha/beta hydrolase n=1 Tax=Bizionia psychrotolerans TaxID=1492901 RepID=UPI000651D5D1|nr:alpha/beta hydrolase-fold protein [Bizionia psychrotolerans]